MFDVYIVLGAFAMAITVVWIASREKVTKARLRAELQRELLSKFSTGQELAEFMNTDGGKLLLMQEPRTSGWVPKYRVIRLVVAGIVVLAAGTGFFLTGTDAEAASLFIAVGVGLLLSAIATHLLAKKFGLADQSNETATRIS